VQEGSPPDPAPESQAPEATPPAAGEVTPEATTPEQVEAIWKNRVAGKDRAHAAAEAALRDQIADLNRRLEGKQAVDAENMSDVERANARAEAAEQRAQAAEQQRLLDVRAVKYAAAAEALDDPAQLATMDEAKLAALNARLTGDETPPPPPTVIDPNAARRPGSTPPAAPRDRSIEQLESDLKDQAPAFSESLNQ
jgi:hypothetical protein